METTDPTTADAPIETIDDAYKLFEDRYQDMTCQARHYFRDYTPEARDEAVANALFLTWQGFIRLIERAMANETLLTTTFSFACRRTRGGRMARTVKHSRTRELWSHARHDTGIDLDGFVASRTPVLDAVIFKVDTETWLDSLPPNQRQHAIDFADGHGTSELAEQYQVSSGRVSQWRTQLKASYTQFVNR